MEINSVDFAGEMDSRRMKTGRRFASNSSAAEANDDTSSVSLLDPSCELTVHNLAAVISQLMRASGGLRQAAASHNALVDEIEYFLELTGGIQTPDPMSYGADAGVCTRLISNLHHALLYVRYLFIKNFRSGFYTVYGIFCALLSAVILWSEVSEERRQRAA